MKKLTRKLISFLVVALLVAMCFSTSVNAEGEANPAAQSAKDGIFQVQIVYTNPATGIKYQLQSGTGFLIGSEPNVGEYVITCNHVATLDAAYMAQCKEFFGVDANSRLDTSIEVVVKGTVTVGATIVNNSDNDDMDFAILKLAQPISDRKTLPLKNHNIEATSDVYALGFPGIVSWSEDFSTYTTDDVTVTKGSISKLTTRNGYDYILSSAVIASGNSGGPLIDAEGNVVGVNTGSVYEDSSAFYYALNIGEITEVLDNLGIPYITDSGAPQVSTTTGQTDEPTSEVPSGPTKAELSAEVRNAESYSESDYTPESYAKLTSAIDKANEVMNNVDATDDDVQTAFTGLKEAEAGLVEAEVEETVDKSKLQDAISEAELVNAKNYKKAAYQDYQRAIEKAKEVNDNDGVTQSDVDKAVSDLAIAKSTLDRNPVSNTTLFIIIGIIAVVVILVVVLIIVLVSSSKKKKEAVVSNNSYRPNPTPVPMPAPTPIAAPTPMPTPSSAPAFDPGRRPSASAYPAPPTLPSMAEGAGETVLLNEGSGETTLLSETNQSMAYLIKTRTGEKISIAKKEFKVGKERSKVDYCITNNSVSRVHAIITFENNEYYVTDNNSTNYTFVNGEAIRASQKVKLSNNDRIKFSDEEFQFKLS